MVSNHGKDAAEIERRRSDGGGLLAAGGASRGNMFSGDAPRCSATMSVLRDRQRSSAKEYFAYFADPYGFTRTLALYFWDVLLELRAARRQRRRGEEHIDRGGALPADARRDHGGHARPQRRDRCSATSSRASRSSTRPSSATTRSPTTPGSSSPTPSRCSGSTTHQLARLEDAIAQAPRPYHLVVLSDHGQSQGRPFRQRYGMALEELVESALASGDVFAPPAPDEGLSHGRRAR